MKKLSVILASSLLFGGISFASPLVKQDNPKNEKKVEKKEKKVEKKEKKVEKKEKKVEKKEKKEAK